MRKREAQAATTQMGRMGAEDPSRASGRAPLNMPVAMAVVAGASAGLRAADRATVIQLRAPAMSARAFEAEATALVGASPVPVLISSRCDIALASGAAGVNLPERDITVEDARALMGARLVGRSVHSLESAMRAERQGADFVIFGPIWSSRSHPDSRPAGLEALAEVARALRIPVLAIGGVTQERIAKCHDAGAAGFAAIALFQ
jgi:thiamine-phosphate diphosphorylase